MPVDRALTLAYLRVTPGMLREMTRDCTPAQATTPPKPGEWAMVDVVRHLVEGDRDTLLPRLRRMLAESRPVFPRREPLRNDGSDLATLLDVFERARADVVRRLSGLEPAGWLREGVSPSRGTLSVETYAASTVEHDTEHLRQLQDIRASLGLTPRRCEARVALPASDLADGLAATPRRIVRLVEGLDGAALRARPADGEWSLVEVLAHLTDLERTLFQPRFRRVLAEDRPAFEPFDPKAWEQERDHRARDFATDLRAFTRARAETLALLGALPAGGAERLGLSAHFGPMTLGQYATHTLDHDLEHLGQMAACRAALRRDG
ncbi:MAG TPA: DinB family protein [Methylomirabilota bacterium]|nr:DinB family protein [Methylomirabilota bacterium]